MREYIDTVDYEMKVNELFDFLRYGESINALDIPENEKNLLREILFEDLEEDMIELLDIL